MDIGGKNGLVSENKVLYLKSALVHSVSFRIVFFESVAVTKLSPNMISTGPRGILGLVKIIFGGQIIEQFLN